MKPPFTISNSMLNKVVEISKILGNLEFQRERNLKLRKENRIKSIHSSLAIENNSLSIEQITAIIEGKRVLGNPKEIREVTNAYDAYEEILKLNPYKEKDFLKAHALLTQGIVNTSGKYRNKDVGIYDQAGNVVHMGARPQYIQDLMRDLFSWGKTDDTPEIIKSCVFHYEIETIHPFEDGNGRMGRLWQSIILANWNPIFAWIPIETLIYENQQEYYDVLGKADKVGKSDVFIEFMLDIILKTLLSYQEVDVTNRLEKETHSLELTLNPKEKEIYNVIKKYLETYESINSLSASKLTGKSAPTIRKYLAKFVGIGLLEAQGANKNRTYRLLTDFGV